MTYTIRDSLQVAAGFQFVPTYWRTHRYQSTTLTVEEPDIHQRIFPAAFKGAMIKGDKYFEQSGFSYKVYGGVAQRTEFLPAGLTIMDHASVGTRSANNNARAGLPLAKDT